MSVQPLSLSVQHAMSCCSQLEATPLYFCHRLLHLGIGFLCASSIKTASGTKAFSDIMMLLLFCHAGLMSLILRKLKSRVIIGYWYWGLEILFLRIEWGGG